MGYRSIKFNPSSIATASDAASSAMAEASDAASAASMASDKASKASQAGISAASAASNALSKAGNASSRIAESSTNWNKASDAQSKANAHSARHQALGADEINVNGLSGELADGQTPKAHNFTHEGYGGTDPIKLDDLAAPDDNTDLDVTILKHGLVPKAPNDVHKFLRGDVGWERLDCPYDAVVDAEHTGDNSWQTALDISGKGKAEIHYLNTGQRDGEIRLTVDGNILINGKVGIGQNDMDYLFVLEWDTSLLVEYRTVDISETSYIDIMYYNN